MNPKQFAKWRRIMQDIHILMEDIKASAYDDGREEGFQEGYNCGYEVRAQEDCLDSSDMGE